LICLPGDLIESWPHWTLLALLCVPLAVALLALAIELHRR
jgi:hypothetical protein